MDPAAEIVLFSCERYNARITRQACEQYQANNRDACRGCQGVKQISNPTPREEDVSGRKVAKCKSCGREKIIIGRGLCGGCYSRVRKAEQKNDKPDPAPPAKASPKQSLITLTIKSAKDQQLINSVTDLAGRQRRTVEQQILWMLDKAIKIDPETGVQSNTGAYSAPPDSRLRTPD